MKSISSLERTSMAVKSSKPDMGDSAVNDTDGRKSFDSLMAKAAGVSDTEIKDQTPVSGETKEKTEKAGESKDIIVIDISQFIPHAGWFEELAGRSVEERAAALAPMEPETGNLMGLTKAAEQMPVQKAGTEIPVATVKPQQTVLKEQPGTLPVQQELRQETQAETPNRAEQPVQIIQNQSLVQSEKAKIPAESKEADGKTYGDKRILTDQTNAVEEPDREHRPVETVQDMKAAGLGQTGGPEVVKIKVAEPYRTLDSSAVKQLSAKISEGISKGKEEFQIQLTPEHLGRITIKISVAEEGVRISLGCEGQKALSLLSEKATDIGQIVENSLNRHAVVEVKEDGYWNQQKNAADQQSGRNGGEQREQGKRQKRDETDNFIQQLRLGMSFEDWAV